MHNKGIIVYFKCKYKYHYDNKDSIKKLKDRIHAKEQNENNYTIKVDIKVEMKEFRVKVDSQKDRIITEDKVEDIAMSFNNMIVRNTTNNE